MTMKLLRFRVRDFRSVADSGWIETGDVTAMVGTNESGKTNLLLPLWKLNPANDGEINTTADYPRRRLTELRRLKLQPVFIEAVFDADDDFARRLSELTGSSPEDLREVFVARDFGGRYIVSFPAASAPRTVPAGRVRRLLSEAGVELGKFAAIVNDGQLGNRVVAAIDACREQIPGDEHDEIGKNDLDELIARLETVSVDAPSASSTIFRRFARLKSDLRAIRDELARPLPADVPGVFELVTSSLPRFVYYSDYGNLDSEIYLPHVIENLKRSDLGAKERAKAQTLKVLFTFVGLSPEEILELGHDAGTDPKDIDAITAKKKLRSILLQSASSLLTDKFREWWKQGDYRFRFEADGDHFRIWVSDDKRPEEIELEGRSSGLQWFLSFYLAFLVESKDGHEGSILLLDEPGLSLHPLAQRDLSHFLDSLAETNQLIYTTHSPFLVNAHRLERLRRVYLAQDGSTTSSAELRASEHDVGQRGSGYAVQAAVNLGVAESLLMGCEPVIVEAPSDQHYLTAIKTVLSASGRLKAGRELVFAPAGNARGVRPVASLLLGRDGPLPVALFKSDQSGRTLVQSLRSTLYAESPQRVLQVGDFVSVPDAEVEDLVPREILVKELDRWQRSADTPFVDVVRDRQAVVPQIEQWASSQRVDLPLGWKEELAKRVTQALLSRGPDALPAGTVDLWQRIFRRFTIDAPATTHGTAAGGSGDRG